VAAPVQLEAEPALSQTGRAMGAAQPGGIPIGERRKPDPRGRPWFLRVDAVRQGDWEGVKGVYRINAVDAETQ
jgi:hypothetical protein